MKTIAEVIELSAQYLHKHRIDRAKREAEDLLAFVLKMKRIDLYLDFLRPLSEEELSQLRELLKQRAQGIPYAYLVKQMAFFGVLLDITSDVLVPRPETEILVEKICDKLQTLSLDNKVLWDVCTGSGCIGIAIKKRFPQLQVILSDISKEAVAVAQKNALLNKVELSVRVGDLFVPFAQEKCNFLVCNPPYLTQKEYEQSSRELMNEPKNALVADEDGLIFYKRIAEALPHVLHKEGLGFFEIGTGQGVLVKDIFKNKGYHNTRVESDYAHHSRFFFLE